ncbi:MAG: hypothetical protein C0468_01495 [Planctomyces sp.]|nr:hypothetical protein [Planctomyces sp.]MBA4119642.1 hypothetical protein [Isosphaera sp.]
MFTLLDRYIARQYLINVVLLLVILFSFVVMIDVTLNLQRFVNVAVREAQRQNQELTGVRRWVVATLLVANLWWPRLLQLFNYVIGLALIAGMGFTVTQMVRHRELVAVMASGVSLYRVMRPIMAVAVVMLGVRALNQELVMPRIAHLVARDNSEAARRDYSTFPVDLMSDGQGRNFLARSFDPAGERLEGLSIYERDEAGRVTRRIDAESAEYRGGRWQLRGGLAWPMEPRSAGPLQADPEPVSEVVSDLSGTAILSQRYRTFAENLSARQILGMLGDERLKPELRQSLTRIMLGRASLTVATVLCLIVAVPFFLTREPRSMVVQTLKCAPVALGSLLGATLAVVAPMPGLPVELSVFVPVIALLPTAIALGTSIKT